MKGEIVAFRDENVMLLAWKDKRIVTMLSTWDTSETESVERRVRGEKSKEEEERRFIFAKHVNVNQVFICSTVFEDFSRRVFHSASFPVVLDGGGVEHGGRSDAVLAVGSSGGSTGPADGDQQWWRGAGPLPVSQVLREPAVHGEEGDGDEREDGGQDAQRQHVGDALTLDHVFVHRKLGWKLQGGLAGKVCGEVPGHGEGEADAAEGLVEGGGVVAGAEEVRERGAVPAGPDRQRAEHQGHGRQEVGQQHQVLAVVDLIRNAPAGVELGQHGHIELLAGHVHAFHVRGFPKANVHDGDAVAVDLPHAPGEAVGDAQAEGPGHVSQEDGQAFEEQGLRPRPPEGEAAVLVEGHVQEIGRRVVLQQQETVHRREEPHHRLSAAQRPIQGWALNACLVAEMMM
ncbi:hypothetical protein QTO34_018448 [Cnephaeus nilssonii]|uniref:Uncharacterized protein n=1 Tax=Cnephaeus nilssonii TaxID=3371016 RepID=A0AA40HYU1_CNENI|nr:hypothetical protein QTO34_018448 [Eptesicus nilssonii]